MKVTQEPEGLNPRSVRLGALVLGVLSVLSVIAAWLMLVPTPGALERGTPRPVVTFGEPAHIETHLFGGADPISPSTAAALRRLERFGWVDRRTGIVHVPVELAMDLYLSERGGPGGAGRTGVSP